MEAAAMENLVGVGTRFFAVPQPRRIPDAVGKEAGVVLTLAAIKARLALRKIAMVIRGFAGLEPTETTVVTHLHAQRHGRRPNSTAIGDLRKTKAAKGMDTASGVVNFWTSAGTGQKYTLGPRDDTATDSLLQACVAHPAMIKDTYFEQPTSCDKSVFGIWGKFWVWDDKCCTSSKKRGLNHFEAYQEHRLAARAGGPPTCPAPGQIFPTPINQPGVIRAVSVMWLLTQRPIRQVLQLIWRASFQYGPNQARTRVNDFQVWIGYAGRGGVVMDQRVPQGGGAFLPLDPVPAQNRRDRILLPLPNAAGNPDDYTLVAMAHTHPFLENLGAGLDPEPSERDHLFAWAYGIPNIVVTRRGTYVTGPDRRVTRSGVQDQVITEDVAAGNPRLELGFPIYPYHQIPDYNQINWQPVTDPNAAFTPASVPDQLDEPTNGVPLTIPGSAAQIPNPSNGNENRGPAPGAAPTSSP
ncbi:hypothetical protein RhiLY_10038 [Ceratobasidium sp. AG-Ba]|nr:hypothetical protein RhiLY_10038 [Ceratobasidium sp. AG-Ba]